MWKAIENDLFSQVKEFIMKGWSINYFRINEKSLKFEFLFKTFIKLYKMNSKYAISVLRNELSWGHSHVKHFINVII